MPFEIDRSLYARMYGPTTGDRVRLGDTNLLVEVERDEASPGDETLWGLRQDEPIDTDMPVRRLSARRLLQSKHSAGETRHGHTPGAI